MEKTIPLKGLNLSLSADDVADGYMEDISGAHFANGTLRPVLPPIEETEIATGRKVVYIHKVQDKEHAISYDGAKLYFEYVRVGGVVTLGGGATILTPINDLIKVDSVGNMLVVLRTSGVHYILLKGSYAAPEYFSLGTKPPFPVVTFSAVRGYVTNDNLTQVDIAPLEDVPVTTLNPANQTRVTTHVTGIINKLISEKRTAGLFVGAFFVRYAVRLFDDSLAYHSSPILIKGGGGDFNGLPSQGGDAGLQVITFDTTNGQLTHLTQLRIGINTTALSFNVPLYTNTVWGDVVKSIDIFVSEPIMAYDQNGKITAIGGGLTSGNPPTMTVPMLNDEAYLSKIEQAGLFYKVKTIDVSGGVSNLTGAITPTAEVLNNLVLQERMTDDFLSHNLLKASGSYTYNAKLHLCGIKETLFEGYQIKSLSGETKAATNYTISVVLKTENGESEVMFQRTESSYIPPFFFYPDTRATKAVISYTGGDQIILPLKKHDFLNGAYYLSPGLVNIIPNAAATHVHAARNTEVATPNKLLVSALNNPLFFPLEGRYTIGKGEIRGMAAATQALSQGQFGQFPIYVFSSDGIWAGEVGGSAYSSFTPVTRDICTGIIRQLDRAIAFVTEDGLMILEGGVTVNISEGLRQTFEAIGPDLVSVDTFIADQSTAVPLSFSDIIDIAYDYPGKRILVIVTGGMFVCSIKEKEWTMIPFAGELSSINAYERCLLNFKNVSGTQILNFSVLNYASATALRDISFVTRPIKLATGLKRISRILFNGIIKEGTVKVGLYGSRDGVAYTCIKGLQAEDRFPIFGIKGTPYKYFVLVVSLSQTNAQATLSSVTFEFEPAYTNKVR